MKKSQGIAVEALRLRLNLGYYIYQFDYNKLSVECFICRLIQKDLRKTKRRIDQTNKV